jgi:hypothetical protein
MDKVKRLIKEILSTPPKKEKCNCGCHSCENVGNPGPVLNESLNTKIIMTENMTYHVKNKLPIAENMFRYGSESFLDMWAEARYLYSRNAIHVNDLDKEILLETNLGEYGIYEGQKVPLDLPMLEEDEDAIGGKKDMEYIKIIPFRALSNLMKIVGEEIERLKTEELDKGIDYTGDLQLLSPEDKKIVQKRLRMLNLLKDLDKLFSFENKNIHYNTVVNTLKKYNALDLLSSVDAGLNENDYLGNEEDIETGIMSFVTPIINDLNKKAKSGDKKAAQIHDELVLAITPEEKQDIINKYFPEKLNESEDKKTPALNKPKRGGSKKFYVYVRDPKTKKIKKVSFGMAGGGLKAKLNNPKARQAFSKRHDCPNKKDKTKASYWSCRLPRYAKALGFNTTFTGYW